MQTVNIHAAKTHLSRLVDEAAAGQEIIIAKAGKPMAKLVPLSTPATQAKRVLGPLDGQFNIPDDFDTMLAEEIADAFEGF